MKLFRLIAINLVVLLALALVGELVFGQWLGASPLGRLAVPRNVRTTVSAAPLYPGGGEFVYRRDAMGFRGAGVDPARIGILTVGGSTTNQLYLREEATWQAVLERSLRQTGHDVVVANAGIDGQSTVGMIADLELWFPNVPHLTPHLVAVYVGINDVYITRPTKAHAMSEEELRQILRDSLQFSSFMKGLEQRSALVHLWTTVTGSIQASRARLGHHATDFARAQWTDQPAQPIWPADQLKANLAAYKDRLVRIAELIERLGATPVFVTQTRADYRLENGRLTGITDVDGPNGVDRGRALVRFNAATMEVCRDRYVTCLDLATELPFSEGDFYDYEHNTPQGAEKIGKWLAGKLVGLV
jgi:GDSL-like lipase/acylhydrolase family protein